MSENYYQILGVPSDADERQVKRAYHNLARELHPDKAESPEKAREFERKFAEVSKAYNVLKDAAQREEYNRKTGASAPAGSPNGSHPTATTAVLNAARAAAASAPNSTKPAKGGGASQQQSSNSVMTPERAAIAQKAYMKGLILLKQNEFAKASEFFEAAISNNEAEPSYHAKLAMALIGAKKSASRAIQAGMQAIELDKYNLDYKFNMAQIYDAIGSKSNAVKMYEEILRWDPENQSALQMLRTLNKKNNFLGRLGGDGGLFSGLRGKFSR